MLPPLIVEISGTKCGSKLNCSAVGVRVDQAGEGGDKDPGDDLVVEENLPSMVSSFRNMSSGQMLTAWLGLRIVMETRLMISRWRSEDDLRGRKFG